MSRRGAGSKSSSNQSANALGGKGAADIHDPDPTKDFPEWSRSLLLMLDYAIIEGLRRRLYTFTHLLRMAQRDLSVHVEGAATAKKRTSRKSRRPKGDEVH